MLHRLDRLCRRPFAALALATLLSLASCGGDDSPTSPTPPPAPAPGVGSGPTTITFVEATPVPGSTLSGCGPQVAGCVNRLRVRVDLHPSQSGPVLYAKAFLHADTKRACLSASTGPMTIAAGQVRPLELVFDQAEDCGVPLTIATLAVVVEGTIEVASRQEWSIAYTLRP